MVRANRSRGFHFAFCILSLRISFIASKNYNIKQNAKHRNRTLRGVLWCRVSCFFFLFLCVNDDLTRGDGGIF